MLLVPIIGPPARTGRLEFDAWLSDRPTLPYTDDGIFDTGELEEFLADLYAMRRSDAA